jgi:hypothetical protein
VARKTNGVPKHPENVGLFHHCSKANSQLLLKEPLQNPDNDVGLKAVEER